MTTHRVLEDLRSGDLRLIGPKLRRLSPPQARAISAEACRRLQRVLRDHSLSPDHRWLVTALQHLAPPNAGPVLAEALRQSIRLTGCCGCTRNRLMRALGTVRPVEAIPALVDIVCRVGQPAHKQLAAVCIEKIAAARGPAAQALLRRQAPRLRRELNRIERAIAATNPVTPPRPWNHIPGSPLWFAAAARAQKALQRLLHRAAA